MGSVLILVIHVYIVGNALAQDAIVLRVMAIVRGFVYIDKESRAGYCISWDLYNQQNLLYSGKIIS